MRPDPKKLVVRQVAPTVAPAPAPTPAPVVTIAAPAPAPVVPAPVAAKPVGKNVPPLRAQVLKNATLQAAAAAADKDKDKDKKTGPLAAEPSPRKLSLLPVLPGKDLINDMRNSV